MTKQCDYILRGRQCIYVCGHGGEHFSPQDGRDHSDEIRIRVLKDSVEHLTAERDAAADAQFPANYRKQVAAQFTEHAKQLAAWRDALISAGCACRPGTVDGESKHQCNRCRMLATVDPGAALMERHAAQLAVKVRTIEAMRKGMESMLAEHAAQLAAYRKALATYHAKHLDDCAIRSIGAVLARIDGAAPVACSCGLDALLQSADPAKALLKRHAEELARERELQSSLRVDWGIERDHRQQLGEQCEEYRLDLEVAQQRAHALARAIDPMSESPVAERSTESLVAVAEGLWARAAVAEADLTALRATQAADLARIEESFNARTRELEERARKAEAALVEAKRDTARRCRDIVIAQFYLKFSPGTDIDQAWRAATHKIHREFLAVDAMSEAPDPMQAEADRLVEHAKAVMQTEAPEGKPDA